MAMVSTAQMDCYVDGKNVQITGTILKTARLRSEYFVRLEQPEAFLAEVRRSGIRADILTFVQDVDDRSPRYAFHCERDQMAVLPITTYEYWFTKQLYNKPRNTLRKALKSGVEVRREEFGESLLQGIKAIYDETPIRQGRRNRHYKKDFETLRREHATFLDRSEFITAQYSGEMIGFAKVTFTGECGVIMNFLSKVGQRDKAPNNALIAKAVEICAERQLKCLMYGVWGSGGSRGLMEFKMANGFECVEVPRYYVPLTQLGRLAVAAGIHNGLVARLPKWCVRVAADVRRRWTTLVVRGAPAH
jgi:hypothetical protein